MREGAEEAGYVLHERHVLFVEAKGLNHPGSEERGATSRELKNTWQRGISPQGQKSAVST